uniref:Uncharacterized protein n=1 Tax=Oryza brachyantha TaxID=4533 RepID=J3LAR7_ORYBR
MPLAELQVLLDLVQHRAAAGVDAEVLEGELEVRDVRPDLGGDAKLPGGQRRGEQQLLRQRQHERAEGGDVRLQRAAAPRHEVPGQRDADVAVAVLLLGDAREALVVAALVGAHRVHQLVLGPRLLRPPVRQQDRRAAHPEEAVGHELRAVVAGVPVEGDVLRADHQRVRVGVHLEEVLGEIDGEQAGAAAHAPQVVAGDVAAELVVVHHHGGQRRRRVEQAAVDDEDADVLGAHARLAEEVVDGAEHDGLRLEPRLRHARVGRHPEHGGGEVGVVAEARPLDDLALELEAVGGGAAREPGAALNGVAAAPALRRRLVAGEVDEVDGARAGQEVDGGEEHEEGGAGHDGDEVEAEVRPEVSDVAGGERGEVDGDGDDERRQQEVHAVGDEVVVPELHVLEPHRLLEVRHAPPRRRRRRGGCPAVAVVRWRRRAVHGPSG